MNDLDDWQAHLRMAVIAAGIDPDLFANSLPMAAAIAAENAEMWQALAAFDIGAGLPEIPLDPSQAPV